MIPSPRPMTGPDPFERVHFLNVLSEADRERLRPHTKLRVLDRDQPCWSEGQSSGEFAFAVRGRLKMLKSGENGRNTILEIHGPGELLCAHPILCHAPQCCTSLAMEDDTEVALIPRREVMDLLERSPAAARAFTSELAEHAMLMCKRIEELGGGHVERRIALLLLKLAKRCGVAVREHGPAHGDGGPSTGVSGTRIPVALTRQDIADLCGTTVETAIRVMSKLKKRGIVLTVTRGFLIPDLQALEALV